MSPTGIASRSMDITERLLDDAGLTPGMKVLDLGCGRGDVSLMIARRVGPEGHVVGVDRDAGAIDVASERLAEAGHASARFAVSDLNQLTLAEETFDAIVARRVLMYLPDPVGTLRRLLPHLRPGGRVILQEHDATMLPGRLQPFPEHEKLLKLMWRTVEREGADVHIGFHLPEIFVRAGLQLEHIHAEVIVRARGLAPDAGTYDYPALANVMLPRMERHGIATAADIGLDTLAERLAAEFASATTAYVGDMAFCAWASKPEDEPLRATLESL